MVKKREEAIQYDQFYQKEELEEESIEKLWNRCFSNKLRRKKCISFSFFRKARTAGSHTIWAVQ